MTYRERYAQHPTSAAPSEDIHMYQCPDANDDNNPCRHPEMTCRACWDREIPECQKPAAAPKPDAVLTVTVTGDNIQTNAEGYPGYIQVAVFAAVQSIAKTIYSEAPTKLDAEKYIHAFQQDLSPTSKIWDFSEEDDA